MADPLEEFRPAAIIPTMEQPELRFATGADGTRIAYSTLGDGPLLVMTPGRGIPAAHWGRLPALLAERFRVLLYDVRGVGATEVASDEASMEDIADDLHHLVEAEGGPAYSLGHAFGGWVTAIHALHHPGDVRGLVIANLAGVFPPGPGVIEAQVGLAPRRVSREEYAERFADIFFGPGFGATVDAQTFLTQRWEAGQERAKIYIQTQAQAAMERMHYWGTWTQPSLLLFGTHDQLATPPHGSELARMLPDAELHWLYPAGHFAPLETPEAFAAHVENWTRRLDAR